jgi:uncharacterized membrane protein
MRPDDAVPPAAGPLWETARVEAFSDGVFAIAITLLVLEISIEPEEFDHLWRALFEAWPSYLSYVTGFLTVGGVWLAHHALFTSLRAIDGHLLRLNVALLMAAAFLPFPTGLLAEAFDASREAERAAIVVYGATAGVIEALLAAMRRHVAAHPELHAAGAPAPVHRPVAQQAARPALYGAAMIVGLLLLPRLAAVLYLLVAARAVLVPGREGRLTLGGRD